jgi:hypothetical protein
MKRPFYYIGKSVSYGAVDMQFRRPLTPAGIVAEERKRFEDWAEGTHEYNFEFDLERLGDGSYSWDYADLCWKAWRAALGIDPMGDV